MKPIFKFLSIIIVLSIVTTGCSFFEKDPSKYTSYVCYETNLSCLLLSNEVGRTTITRLCEDGYEDTAPVVFQKISSVSDDQFIFAYTVIPMPGANNQVVMQNPNDYVDIWNDWTIKKIELCFLSYNTSDNRQIESNRLPNEIPTEVITSTTEQEIFSDFLGFIEDRESTEGFKYPEGFSQDRVRGRFYIRVFFEESGNIIWLSNINSYYSAEEDKRIICLEGDTTPDGIASPQPKYINICNNDHLKEWICIEMENSKWFKDIE